MAPRTVGTGDSERTSPGTAPGADPTSVQGATGTEDGQEGQQGQQ